MEIKSFEEFILEAMNSYEYTVTGVTDEKKFKNLPFKGMKVSKAGDKHLLSFTCKRPAGEIEEMLSNVLGVSLDNIEKTMNEAVTLRGFVNKTIRSAKVSPERIKYDGKPETNVRIEFKETASMKRFIEFASKTIPSNVELDSSERMNIVWISVKSLLDEAKGDKEKYQEFFQNALKKFGVSSPDELGDKKKKEFFDYVDANYTSDDEEAGIDESTKTCTIEYVVGKLNMISSVEEMNQWKSYLEKI